MGEIIRAAAMDAMTSAERKAVHEASVMTDLDGLPPTFLDRIRESIDEHIAATESPRQ